MNQCFFVSLLLVFFCGVNAEKKAHQPFASSLRILERYFIANHANISYPEASSCTKVYVVIDPILHNPKLKVSCKEISSPDSFSVQIGFKHYPKFNGLRVSYTICSCKSGDYFFHLVGLHNEKYFTLKAGKKNSTFYNVEKFIEFVTENKTNKNNQLEINESQQIHRLDDDIVNLLMIEDMEISEKSSSRIHFAEISSVHGCQPFYSYFNRSYELNLQNNEVLKYDCEALNLSAERGFRITSTRLSKSNQSVTGPSTFCYCRTILLHEKSKNESLTLDETSFYLTKIVKNKKNFYYLLVDNLNILSLDAVGYYETKETDQSHCSQIKDLIKVTRPLMSKAEINKQFFSSYNDLSWGIGRNEEYYTTSCVAVYSASKLVDLDYADNMKKNCQYYLYPDDGVELVMSKFSEGFKAINVVKCDCAITIASAKSNAPLYEQLNFYIVKLRNGGKYYRLQDEDGLLMPIDYIEISNVNLKNLSDTHH